MGEKVLEIKTDANLLNDSVTKSTNQTGFELEKQENGIALKTVSNLLSESFFIPSYQRGYRWTKKQVEDLLNDIWEFAMKPKESEWYCLQPVVVKKQKNNWEVIDGQQRLTTIFLILKQLEKFIESDRKTFLLTYETRIDCESFLRDINSVNTEAAERNIDYLHIYNAYIIIQNWFRNKANSGYNSISSKFISPFLDNTKVIWYESVNDDSIDIFTRINSGKIPLTNSELIKALFLNSSNFNDKDVDKIKMRQFEIASEWDDIEYSLQNESFWWFINEKENKLSTRIEFIFDLIANKTAKDDEYYTFRFFNEKFQNKNVEIINSNWNEIKRYFQTLSEWFSDRELYHKIGFLIVQGVSIKTILELKVNKTKTEFINELDNVIASKIPDEISDLEYGDQKIKNVLLLHNIESMLNNENETNHFPFDRYKKEKWDVEHITAIADKLTDEKHQKEWLIETLKFVPENKLKPEWQNFDKNTFSEISKEIVDCFSEEGDINDISNLTLLDAGTNRSYKNAVFPVKRKTIIEREKTGTFIPLCTKNVFMKFYSDNVNQMTFWGIKDREAYLEDIKITLKVYKNQKN